MKKLDVKTFSKYIFSSGISFIIDYSLFAVFAHFLKLSIGNKGIIFATIFARIISSIINIYLSKGHSFNCISFNDWEGITNVILSVLVFIFISNINLDNINIKLKRIIAKISELSLGIYLTSAVVDDFLYFNYFKDIDLKNAIGYLRIVPLVFILSISLSMIINWMYNFINKFILEKYIKRILINNN